MRIIHMLMRCGMRFLVEGDASCRKEALPIDGSRMASHGQIANLSHDCEVRAFPRISVPDMVWGFNSSWIGDSPSLQPKAATRWLVSLLVEGSYGFGSCLTIVTRTGNA